VKIFLTHLRATCVHSCREAARALREARTCARPNAPV
jgi:hypothetical protein